jgi:hypothetical protein
MTLLKLLENQYEIGGKHCGLTLTILRKQLNLSKTELEKEVKKIEKNVVYYNGLNEKYLRLC